jgi:hypothetical protein
MRIVYRSAAAAALLLAGTAQAATMFSVQDSYMGPGKFYGPGRLRDTEIFDVKITGIGFTAPAHYVTPFANNGAAEPNLCGERELGRTPTGVLSDGVTRINENVDACRFMLNDSGVLVAVVDGGGHEGQQVAVTLEDHGEITMIMTMDFAIDMGVGKGGVIRLPFYGTTGEVVVPESLQTQMGIEGGVELAGSLRPGDKIRGRLGDYDGNGVLDGAIVVAGNIPLDSIFMPGAPYALIRYFETDVPYQGAVVGKLPSGEPKPRHTKLNVKFKTVGQ